MPRGARQRCPKTSTDVSMFVQVAFVALQTALVLRRAVDVVEDEARQVGAGARPEVIGAQHHRNAVSALP